MGKENKRPFKGRRAAVIPDEFVAIDIETTGLNPTCDEIVEVSAVRYRNGHEVEAYETLVKPTRPLSAFVTLYNKITNDMVADAPAVGEIMPPLRAFIGDSVLLGHNVHFDINFLYDAIERAGAPHLSNDFIDTMGLLRRIKGAEAPGSLADAAQAYSISVPGHHRAGWDSRCAAELFLRLVSSGELQPEHMRPPKRQYHSLSEIVPESDCIDPYNPCYGKTFVFTGALTRFLRTEAMQEVVNRGGNCKKAVTKNTNFLVEGDFDHVDVGEDGESTKQQKARELQLKGYDICVISESAFLDMLGDDGAES